MAVLFDRHSIIPYIYRTDEKPVKIRNYKHLVSYIKKGWKAYGEGSVIEIKPEVEDEAWFKCYPEKDTPEIRARQSVTVDGSMCGWLNKPFPPPFTVKGFVIKLMLKNAIRSIERRGLREVKAIYKKFNELIKTAKKAKLSKDIIVLLEERALYCMAQVVNLTENGIKEISNVADRHKRAA